MAILVVELLGLVGVHANAGYLLALQLSTAKRLPFLNALLLLLFPLQLLQRMHCMVLNGFHSIFNGRNKVLRNAHCQKWLHNPCRIEGPQCGDEIRSGDITLTILGGHMWANWVHGPCHLGGPQSGDKLRSGYISLAVLGTHMWAKWRYNPCRLGGHQKRARKWLHNPCCAVLGPIGGQSGLYNPYRLGGHQRGGLKVGAWPVTHWRRATNAPFVERRCPKGEM